MGLKRIEKPGPTAASGGLSKILYVEDEDSNWEVTRLHLRGKYMLRRAKNSDEAFRLLAIESFDLILLDIQLSGSELDGLEICKRIRDTAKDPATATMLRPDTPIVFVTAYSARYDKAELLALGGDEVVTKPVDYTRLLLVSARLILRGLTSASLPRR
jgi:CheY-like chemotaxis protein